MSSIKSPEDTGIMYQVCLRHCDSPDLPAGTPDRAFLLRRGRVMARWRRGEPGALFWQVQAGRAWRLAADRGAPCRYGHPQNGKACSRRTYSQYEYGDDVFRNIRKFVTLYLSLNPYDRVKSCVVPTFLCLFVFFISLSSQHGNSQKQIIGVLGSYEQKGCILKVVGKESIDNKGNISTVRFVDRELDSKCLLTVIDHRQVSVSYLNFDLNHRPQRSSDLSSVVWYNRLLDAGRRPRCD